MTAPIIRPTALRDEWAVRIGDEAVHLFGDDEHSARALADADPSWALLRRQVSDWTEVPS